MPQEFTNQRGEGDSHHVAAGKKRTWHRQDKETSVGRGQAKQQVTFSKAPQRDQRIKAQQAREAAGAADRETAESKPQETQAAEKPAPRKRAAKKAVSDEGETSPKETE